MSCCFRTHFSSGGGGGGGGEEGTCYTTTGNAPLQNEQLLRYPLARDSASRRPIGSGALYHPVNHPANVAWRLGNGIRINSGNNFGHRLAVGTDDDPLVSVTKNAASGGGQNLPFSLRVPRLFTGGTEPKDIDQGVTIYDKTTGVAHQFFQFYRVNDNNATAKGHYVLDIDGRDWKPIGGARHTSSAANIYQVGLLARGTELGPADGPPIAHAFGASLGRLSTHQARQLSPDIIWPASGRDGSAGTENIGDVPYGALFAIPPVSKGGPDIENMAGITTPQQKRYIRAFRDYGVYAVDGGGGGPCIRGDNDLPSTLRTSLQNAVDVVFEHFRMVSNNVQSDPYVVGGGEPLHPNCAWNSPNVTWATW